MKNMPNSTPAPLELSFGETTPGRPIASNGVDRRNFLRCMAWVETGVMWTVTAPNPGPMVVPAGKLESVLGVTSVQYIAGHSHLAIIDSSLADIV